MVTVSKRARCVSADLKVHEELSVCLLWTKVVRHRLVSYHFCSKEALEPTNTDASNQQMLKVSAVSDRETAGWYYMIFIADMNPEEMFPHVEVVVWITVDTNKTSIQEILSGTKWVTNRFDLNTFRRSLHSFTCINTPKKIWHQGVQHYSVLVGMSTRCLVGRFYLRLWFPVIPVFRSSSSSSSLAQLLGPMLFLEVDKAAGGLWDRSEGSDWRVTDPERWNSAFLLFIIIIIIPQIDDITETTTQTHELNVFTGGWK